MVNLLKKVCFGGCSAPSWVADLGLAVLRVFAGLAMALGHGWGKVPPSERFVENVGAMGFPMPAFFAWSAGLSELLGGLLLALGLMTRLAALMVGVTMAVAGFIRHAPDPFVASVREGQAGKELALLYLAVMIAFLLKGAGRFSIDRLIRGRN